MSLPSDPGLWLQGAQFLTMDPAMPEASWVLVSGGRVEAVGPLDGPGADGSRVGQRVDLRGLVVVPGFNDCHMHVLGLGLTLMGVDVSPASGVSSPAELRERLRSWAAEHPEVAWIRGYGYNQNVFPNAEHVRRADLDAAVEDRPVTLFHVSGHAAVANTLALRNADIVAETPDPPGGTVVRDEAGVPTGLLLESAIGLITRAIPPLTRAEKTEAILRACRSLAAKGVTSACDMGVGGPALEDDLAAYRSAVEQGAPVRITLCPETTELWDAERIPPRTELEAAWGLPFEGASLPGSVRLGPLKLYADGALTTRTAAVSEPYVDGAGTGMLLHEPEELSALIACGHRQGWQIATHAIGDRAIEVVLGAYEQALRAHPDPDRRHRIEHAMMTTPEQARRMGSAGVAAVLQPEFLARLGDAYVLGLGAERAARLNPVRTLLDCGVPLAFSSDCPVVPGAPLDGIRAAIRRTTPSGRALGPEQSCWVAEALAAYTRGAAFACRDEQAVGCIRKGFRADLVVLSSLPDTEGEVSVLAVMSGGLWVHGEDFIRERIR